VEVLLEVNAEGEGSEEEIFERLLDEAIDFSDFETVFHFEEDGRLDEVEDKEAEVSALNVTCCTPDCLEERRCGGTFDSVVVDLHDDPIINPLNVSFCKFKVDF